MKGNKECEARKRKIKDTTNKEDHHLFNKREIECFYRRQGKKDKGRGKKEKEYFAMKRHFFKNIHIKFRPHHWVCVRMKSYNRHTREKKF